MTPILQVTSLGRSFGALRAVADSTFDIAEHEVVSIIGPNGSGKTTTINLISGELRPDAGTVRLRGIDITGRSPDCIARAGLRRTFQNGRVFGNATVETNVLAGHVPLMRDTFPLRGLRDIPILRWIAHVAEVVTALVGTPGARREELLMRDRVTEQLARFGERLTPRREHRAATLSYANRRRTEIARALASSPDLLLLDEPTAGMNTTETNEVMHQLLDLKAQGQTMLIVEHKLELVMRVSDRVIVMDGGEIIASGSPAEIQADPRVIEAYLGARRGDRVAHGERVEDAMIAHDSEQPASDNDGESA